MKKRFLSILLATLMVVSLLSTTALAADVSTWANLQSAINSASPGETITLTESLTCDTGDSLEIPSGSVITIDLNGYTLDHGLSAVDSNGSVIVVKGTLTIEDGSEPSTGKITGGYNVNGGIYVDAGGELILNSGSIADNSRRIEPYLLKMGCCDCSSRMMGKNQSYVQKN